MATRFRIYPTPTGIYILLYEPNKAWGKEETTQYQQMPNVILFLNSKGVTTVLKDDERDLEFFLIDSKDQLLLASKSMKKRRIFVPKTLSLERIPFILEWARVFLAPDGIAARHSDNSISFAPDLLSPPARRGSGLSDVAGFATLVLPVAVGSFFPTKEIRDRRLAISDLSTGRIVQEFKAKEALGLLGPSFQDSYDQVWIAVKDYDDRDAIHIYTLSSPIKGKRSRVDQGR